MLFYVTHARRNTDFSYLYNTLLFFLTQQGNTNFLHQWPWKGAALVNNKLHVTELYLSCEFPPICIPFYWFKYRCERKSLC